MPTGKHDLLSNLWITTACVLYFHMCVMILITRNTVKVDVLSLYKKEKVILKNLIMSITGRISLKFNYGRP